MILQREVGERAPQVERAFYDSRGETERRSASDSRRRDDNFRQPRRGRGRDPRAGRGDCLGRAPRAQTNAISAAADVIVRKLSRNVFGIRAAAKRGLRRGFRFRDERVENRLLVDARENLPAPNRFSASACVQRGFSDDVSRVEKRRRSSKVGREQRQSRLRDRHSLADWAASEKVVYTFSENVGRITHLRRRFRPLPARFFFMNFFRHAGEPNFRPEDFFAFRAWLFTPRPRCDPSTSESVHPRLRRRVLRAVRVAPMPFDRAMRLAGAICEKPAIPPGGTTFIRHLRLVGTLPESYCGGRTRATALCSRRAAARRG